MGNVRGQGSETPDTLAMTPELVAVFLDEFDDAWNRRDLEDFCAMFTADGSMHFITLGQYHKNPAEIRLAYDRLFSELPPRIRHQSYNSEVIWLARDKYLGLGYTDILNDPGDGSTPELLTRHNGFMIVEVTEEGLKIQTLRAWSEKK